MRGVLSDPLQVVGFDVVCLLLRAFLGMEH
jgi:hypothetical protein